MKKIFVLLLLVLSGINIQGMIKEAEKSEMRSLGFQRDGHLLKGEFIDNSGDIRIKMLISIPGNRIALASEVNFTITPLYEDCARQMVIEMENAQVGPRRSFDTYTVTYFRLMEDALFTFKMPERY